MTYASNEEWISYFTYANGLFYALLFLLLIIILFMKGIKDVIDLFKQMLNWEVRPKWHLFGLYSILTILIVKMEDYER